MCMVTLALTTLASCVMATSKYTDRVGTFTGLDELVIMSEQLVKELSSDAQPAQPLGQIEGGVREAESVPTGRFQGLPLPRRQAWVPDRPRDTTWSPGLEPGPAWLREMSRLGSCGSDW